MFKSTWERTLAYAPTPENFGREHTPSEYGFSPDHLFSRRSTPTPQSQSPQPHFSDGAGWDTSATDNEHQTYIPYIIEWKVTLNNRVLAKDMEQDLVSTPSSYWREIKEKADRILHRKVNRNQRVRPDDTAVVMSVNERSQHDLIKRFEKTDINWIIINRQLQLWQNLARQ